MAPRDPSIRRGSAARRLSGVAIAPVKALAEEDSQRYGGELLAAISDAMVGLQKEFAGKGPERCGAHWAGPDTLMILMGGGYTAAEETLYQSGRTKEVRDARHAFQDAMQERMSRTIEGLTGRRVVAFMSASHQDPDLAAEIFVLEPERGDPEHPLAAGDQALRREP